jgi:hypothetical protein
MTELGDYYRGLPILSRTLNGAFVSSPGLVDCIRRHHYSTLPLAVKLRHTVLFRECIVWLVSSWSNANTKINLIKDIKLRKICTRCIQLDCCVG